MKFKNAVILSFIMTTICLTCKDIYDSKNKGCLCKEEKPDETTVSVAFSKVEVKETDTEDESKKEDF